MKRTEFSARASGSFAPIPFAQDWTPAEVQGLNYLLCSLNTPAKLAAAVLLQSNGSMDAVSLRRSYVGLVGTPSQGPSRSALRSACEGLTEHGFAQAHPGGGWSLTDKGEDLRALALFTLHFFSHIGPPAITSFSALSTAGGKSRIGVTAPLSQALCLAALGEEGTLRVVDLERIVDQVTGRLPQEDGSIGKKMAALSQPRVGITNYESIRNSEHRSTPWKATDKRGQPNSPELSEVLAILWGLKVADRNDIAARMSYPPSLTTLSTRLNSLQEQGFIVPATAFVAGRSLSQVSLTQSIGQPLVRDWLNPVISAARTGVNPPLVREVAASFSTVSLAAALQENAARYEPFAPASRAGSSEFSIGRVLGVLSEGPAGISGPQKGIDPRGPLGTILAREI
jgi:hypothetical protein